MKRSLILLVVASLCGATSSSPTALITAKGRTLRSLHDVPVEVRAPAGFRLLKPTSRRANFDGHLYYVTLAAFVAKSEAVTFHAERVADHSGASNYDDLPASPWPGFRVRRQCATIGAADARDEYDLHWLLTRGWSPVGNLALEQHLKTTADHNQEVVVSIIAHVKSCADKSAVEAVLHDLRSRIRVVPIQAAATHR